MQHKTVFELLESLTDSEKGELVFVVNNKRRKGTYKNDLILYLLSQKKLPTKLDVYKALYKKKGEPYSEEAYQRLITRTASDVLECMTGFIQKTTLEFDEIDVIKIQILQKATLLHYLIGKKSKMALISSLREDIIKSASEYEFYPILIENLYLKKYDCSLIEGEKAYFELENSIIHFERCLSSLRKSSELFNIFKIKSLRTSVHDNKTFGKMLQEHIQTLTKEYEISSSPTVKYFLLQHELSISYLEKDYVNAKKKCLEMKKLVEENKSINRIDRLGIIYDNLAKCDVFLFDYSSALIWSKNAQLCFKNQSRNHWISLEQEFLINIYTKYFQRAEETLNTIFIGQKNNKSPFERNTLLFYKAILHLKNGKYKKAIAILGERTEISQDSIGWDFWTRILIINLNVLLENDDFAHKGVINLKKQIQRISKGKEFRERDMIVFKIMTELSKYGFSNSQKIPKVKLLLQKLKEPKNKWEPFSAEVIPFDELLSLKFKKYKD